MVHGWGRNEKNKCFSHGLETYDLTIHLGCCSQFPGMALMKISDQLLLLCSLGLCQYLPHLIVWYLLVSLCQLACSLLCDFPMASQTSPQLPLITPCSRNASPQRAVNSSNTCLFGIYYVSRTVEQIRAQHLQKFLPLLSFNSSGKRQTINKHVKYRVCHIVLSIVDQSKAGKRLKSGVCVCVCTGELSRVQEKCFTTSASLPFLLFPFSVTHPSPASTRTPTSNPSAYLLCSQVWIYTLWDHLLKMQGPLFKK